MCDVQTTGVMERWTCMLPPSPTWRMSVHAGCALPRRRLDTLTPSFKINTHHPCLTPHPFSKPNTNRTAPRCSRRPTSWLSPPPAPPSSPICPAGPTPRASTYVPLPHVVHMHTHPNPDIGPCVMLLHTLSIRPLNQALTHLCLHPTTTVPRPRPRHRRLIAGHEGIVAVRRGQAAAPDDEAAEAGA